MRIVVVAGVLVMTAVIVAFVAAVIRVVVVAPVTRVVVVTRVVAGIVVARVACVVAGIVVACVVVVARVGVGIVRCVIVLQGHPVSSEWKVIVALRPAAGAWPGKAY
jgi:hypothetical protein